jgi:hypothetical protein
MERWRHGSLESFFCNLSLQLSPNIIDTSRLETFCYVQAAEPASSHNNLWGKSIVDVSQIASGKLGATNPRRPVTTACPKPHIGYLLSILLVAFHYAGSWERCGFVR